MLSGLLWLHYSAFVRQAMPDIWPGRSSPHSGPLLLLAGLFTCQRGVMPEISYRNASTYP
ncbi:Uncharacterised protein [Escherichia coli]|nr:Uncharacterised protein [Escherichia coli]